ncbi:DUF5384 family protein [Pseudomonas sp. NPDC098747]|uniref:DUF5384 family protein n=1 Tax=Pseudomonas sp. NPDC098747 TaxID=3364487 RepID=UPI00383B4E7F
MRSVLAALLLVVATSSQASPFDQLSQVEMSLKQEQEAKKAEALRKADEAAALQRARDDERQRKRVASQRQAQAVALEAKKAKEAEIQRAQARNERFEDEARSLDLESRKLELEARKAQVARSDEYIDAELRAKAARTDVVQSEADATRNISSGTKALLESTGEADVNRSNKLFGD